MQQKRMQLAQKLCLSHSVEISEYFYLSDFTWNQFWGLQKSKMIKSAIGSFRIFQSWFHVKSEWKKNPKISTLCIFYFDFLVQNSKVGNTDKLQYWALLFRKQLQLNRVINSEGNDAKNWVHFTGHHLSLLITICWIRPQPLPHDLYFWPPASTEQPR